VRGTGRATLADAPPPSLRGDFNGDGNPDVVWRNTTTGENELWYLQNTTLVGAAVLPTVADTAWQIVAVADLNANGKPDLVWRNSVTGYNVIWLLDGATFLGQVLLPPIPDLTWQIVAAADINRDGKPDVSRGLTSGT